MTLVYVPRPRGCIGYAVDALVIACAIAFVWVQARRQEVACAWESGQASCTVSSWGPLEQKSTQTIEGIRSLAWHSGTHIGLVTSARNKDEKASFGTRDIDALDDASATTLESFVEERKGPIAVAHGPSHPLLYTVLAMLVVLGYAIGTRPLLFLLTIRDGRVSLKRRGPFFSSSTRSWDLASVRSFDVEKDDSRHRVRVRTSKGESLPLTESFFPGEHHEDFASRASRALSGARA